MANATKPVANAARAAIRMTAAAVDGSPAPYALPTMGPIPMHSPVTTIDSTKDR